MGFCPFTLLNNKYLIYIMVASNKFLQNKNLFPVLLGSLLMVYLYLGTPVPANLILQNVSLIIAIVISILIFCCLCARVNIFVAIIFALVAFDVIKKSLKPNLNDVDKNIQYYNNNILSNTEIVLSDKLKNSNTLEQDMVSKMSTVSGNNPPGQTPRYQPLLADSAGSSQIE